MPDNRIWRHPGRDRPARRYDPDRLRSPAVPAPPRARPAGLPHPRRPAGPATRLRTPATRPRRPDEAVGRWACGRMGQSACHSSRSRLAGPGRAGPGPRGGSGLRPGPAPQIPATEDRARAGAGTAPVRKNTAEDAELGEALVRAQRGDGEAFRLLYRDLQPRLLRYLHALAGQDAEDIASETWLQVTRDLAGFTGTYDGFRGWVATIARHRALDHLRRHQRKPPALALPAEDLATWPAHDDTAQHRPRRRRHPRRHRPDRHPAPRPGRSRPAPRRPRPRRHHRRTTSSANAPAPSAPPPAEDSAPSSKKLESGEAELTGDRRTREIPSR